MIKCLYGGCPKTFVEDEIKLFVSRDVFKKYRKFKITQMKLSNPDIDYIHCPIPDCEDLINIDNITPDQITIICSLGHEFCSICMKEGRHDKSSKCKNVYNIYNPSMQLTFSSKFKVNLMVYYISNARNVL